MGKRAMGGIPATWCFYCGREKSERMKAFIFSTKSSAIARISTTNFPDSICSIGLLVYRNLLLTSHSTLPTAASAVDSDVRFSHGITATLSPHRFFITSPVLDLTVVGLDYYGGEGGQVPQNHHLKICPKPNLDLGKTVYFLGYREVGEVEVGVGEGKVVVSTDSLVKVSATDLTPSPGCVGFDSHGNLAFMICHPMKLATSPHPNSSAATTTSSSTLSYMRRGGNDTWFGIPVPVIFNWLYQHWDVSLDLPKPPVIGFTPLLESSSGVEKAERSCGSHGRWGLKPTPESETDLRRQSLKKENENENENGNGNGNENGNKNGNENENEKTEQEELFVVGESTCECEGGSGVGECESCSDADVDASVPSANSLLSDEIRSSSSPGERRGEQNGYSSERETLYSADTAESRNYVSPRDARITRTGAGYHRRSRAGERQHGTASSNTRSVYYSPTVSSIMKKRDSPDTIGNLDRRGNGLYRQHVPLRGKRFY